MALKRVPVPVRVDLEDGGRVIAVTWPDRRVDRFKAYDLRVACPCALCVDEMSGIRTLDPDEVDPRVSAVAQAPVGRYALQVDWSDGHRTGIYTYAGLRDGRYVP